MAQFYSLEEAANRLAIGTDEFKRRLKTEWTSIRPFRDGATLRFRAADIDELARSLGAASDPGLPLGPVGSTPAEAGDDGSGEEPLNLGGTGEADIFSLTGGDSGTGKKKPGSDSDVRLDTSKAPPGSDPEASLPTEEIALDLSGPPSGTPKKGGSSGKLSAAKAGADLSGPDAGSKIPSAVSKSSLSGPDSSSEFELSLDSDSDSFELQLSGDSSEEVDLGGLDQPSSKRAGQSGINLGKPSDSGVSLEKKGSKSGKVPGSKKLDVDSDVDFELSLDPASSSGVRKGGSKSGGKKPVHPEDSSSEFELTLDDNSGVVEDLSKSLQEEHRGDIFETDFELPALGDESGSEVVAVDDADTGGFEVDVQDLDAPDDDSSSQVVVVDEDEPLIDDDRARVRRGVDDDDAIDEMDLEEGGSASKALRGVRRGVDYDAPAQVVVQTPPRWGPLPAIVLAFSVLFLFLGSLMSFEAVRGMWGYHQPSKPANGLVRGVADTLGMKVSD
jgi:hypothetical protein